ncbi:nucleoside phosphorylase [Shimazuella sp. AN120528]|uniref:nucleoside phosphorylase n=1 Tax=Shimazuella soli TaxID=1892854 RepID=UPI001F0D1CAF|nr:nucleoside phosphorylase [Shimazuella soli]MCH5586074.1 nucleoside phosphorylase [Shimazuella soli]
MELAVQPHIQIGKVKAKCALLPGAPERVDKVAAYLDEPIQIAYNREYKTIQGKYKGLDVLVTSTGIGGASTGIAVEELKNVGINTMIRIGSCGALQDGMRLGDLVIANGSVRHDGASVSYIEKSYPAIPDTHLLFHLVNTAKDCQYPHHLGVIRSHDSFYTDHEAEIDQFWGAHGVLAGDMESAALFVIGRLRQIRTASILNVVVETEGDLKEGINEYVNQAAISAQGEERMIHTACEALVRLYNE